MGEGSQGQTSQNAQRALMIFLKSESELEAMALRRQA
jgi:hypothetical protein